MIPYRVDPNTDKGLEQGKQLPCDRRKEVCTGSSCFRVLGSELEELYKTRPPWETQQIAK